MPLYLYMITGGSDPEQKKGMKGALSRLSGPKLLKSLNSGNRDMVPITPYDIEFSIRVRNMNLIRNVINKYAGCFPRENEIFEIGDAGVTPLMAHLLLGTPDIPEPERVLPEPEPKLVSAPKACSGASSPPKRGRRGPKLTTDFTEVFVKNNVQKVRIRFMDSVEKVEHLKQGTFDVGQRVLRIDGGDDGEPDRECESLNQMARIFIKSLHSRGLLTSRKSRNVNAWMYCQCLVGDSWVRAAELRKGE